MLDAGNYRARAIEAALGETETGKEQVAVQFQLLDLEQTITWYGYFTDKTLETTFKALRTAGWKGQDLTDLSDLCAPAETPEVTLVVEHETYTNPETGESKTRARVRWVNGTGGLALKKALDPNKAKAFAARMRGQLAAFDRSSGAPKPQANGRQHAADSEPSPFTGDDEIPF
jgi:hypothetical protein